MRGIRSPARPRLVALVRRHRRRDRGRHVRLRRGRLRDGLLDEAERQAQFNLSVLVPERLPDGVTREGLDAERPRRGVPAARRRRDDRRLRRRRAAVRLQRGPPPGRRPASRRTLRATGRRRAPRLRLADRRGRAVAGRSAGGAERRRAARFYFVFPAASIDAALEQLRIGLLAAALVAVALALATAGLIARGILRPVDAGSAPPPGSPPATCRRGSGRRRRRVRALRRRVQPDGRFAGSDRARLEASESQNRRFVADVSHELRTPLTALVAEASIIEAGLDAPAARRPPRRASCSSPTSVGCASSSTT